MQLLFIAEKTRRQNFLLNFGLSLVEALVKTPGFLQLYESISWKQFLVTVSGVIFIIPEHFTNSV